MIDQKIEVLQSKIKELEQAQARLITNRKLSRQHINDRDKYLIELMRLMMEKRREEHKPWWKLVLGIK